MTMDRTPGSWRDVQDRAAKMSPNPEPRVAASKRNFRIRLADGTDLGILPEDRVVRLMKRGALGPDAQVQRVGSPRWRRADEVAPHAFRTAEPQAPQEDEGFSALSQEFAGLGGGLAEHGTDDPFSALNSHDPPRPPEAPMPPQMPPVAPAAPRATNRPAAGNGAEADPVLGGGFVALAWATLVTLMLDGMLGVLLALLRPAIDQLLVQQSGIHKAMAYRMLDLVPGPMLSIIPGAILVGWAVYPLPEHARPFSPGTAVAKWLTLSLTPFLLGVVILYALPAKSTQAPFLVAAVGLIAMAWGSGAPSGITRAMNERLGQARWKAWPWLGPLAAGLMITSCVAAATANSWLAWKSAGLVGKTAEDAWSGLMFISVAILIAAGTRLLGLLFTGIWAVQFALAMRKAPRRVVAMRGRFE